MTGKPLKDDELFEVRLDSKVPKWFGTLDIGATTVSPEGLEFPPSMDRFGQGITFALCGNKILNNGNEMTEISKDLNNLTVCYHNQPPKTGNFAVFLLPYNIAICFRHPTPNKMLCFHFATALKHL